MELNSLIYPAPDPSIYLDCYTSSSDPVFKGQLLLVDAHKLTVENGGKMTKTKSSFLSSSKKADPVVY